jgi:hypothetical protein
MMTEENETIEDLIRRTRKNVRRVALGKNGITWDEGLEGAPSYNIIRYGIQVSFRDMPRNCGMKIMGHSMYHLPHRSKKTINRITNAAANQIKEYLAGVEECVLIATTSDGENESFIHIIEALGMKRFAHGLNNNSGNIVSGYSLPIGRGDNSTNVGEEIY